MYNSGEIQRYIDAHPGHYPMSAHQALIAEKRDQAHKAEIEEARQKAVKETEARMTANFKAKAGADTLGSGPATGGGPVDKEPAELKEPKKFGGLTQVLANRLKSRRQAIQ